jgi:hypothetical protein
MIIPPILSPDLATLESARAAAELLKLPRWKAALFASAPQGPLLVQRLDRNDDYYYIIPYVRGQAVTARLIVDAISDRFTEASGIEHDGKSLPPYVDPAMELRRWHGETIEMPSLRVRVIRPGTVGEHPVLIWRPCHESTSPFKPFYLLSVGDEFLYLRVDGQRFPRLTIGPV